MTCDNAWLTWHVLTMPGWRDMWQCHPWHVVTMPGKCDMSRFRPATTYRLFREFSVLSRKRTQWPLVDNWVHPNSCSCIIHTVVISLINSCFLMDYMTQMILQPNFIIMSDVRLASENKSIQYILCRHFPSYFYWLFSWPVWNSRESNMNEKF